MSRVCHITNVHDPYDDRIFYKECCALKDGGYTVYLIAPARTNKNINGIKLISILPQKDRFRRIFINHIVIFFKALGIRASIYHLHDPELLPIGIFLKILGKNVIYDVHELVFESIDDKSYLRNSLLREIIKKSYQILEKLVIRLFDRIILAEDGYKTYFWKNYRKYISKMEFIRNYPVIDLINSSCKQSVETGSPVVIYAGLLAEVRAIRELIQAMGFVTNDVELWLFGKWESNSFYNYCKTLPEWKQTKYKGYYKAEDIYRYMKSASVGIALLYPIKNYLTSLPVKSFEYIACLLPVIISDFPYYRQIFKDNVLYVDPKDPKMIAEKINFIFDNYDSSIAKAQMMKNEVLKNMTWEIEKKQLLKIYKKVLK